MKRIAQVPNTNNDDSAEQSVMLSPRTLLTGPRQIVRLERQYRSLSEDLQNSLENLNRTKDSYVSALHAFEQAEEYIRQLGPKVKMAVMLLNSAKTNPQYLGQASAAIEGIVGGGAAAPAQKTGQSNESMVKIAYLRPGDAGALAGGAAGQMGANVGNAVTPSSSPSNTPSNTPAGTPTQTAEQQAMIAQQISALQAQLSTFVNEMHRRYNMHKQRAAAMEGQYNMSKSAYAKVRAEFFQMQTEISSLTANLSGWNERLSEYYAPSGGEA